MHLKAGTTMSSSIVIVTIPGLSQAVEVTVEHEADATALEITSTAYTALRFAEFTVNGETYNAIYLAVRLG
jgi:hypothetical protein